MTRCVPKQRAGMVRPLFGTFRHSLMLSTAGTHYLSARDAEYMLLVRSIGRAQESNVQ